RENAHQQRGEHYAQAHQHCPLEREALVIAKLDTGQGYQQVGRGHQWAEQVYRLADDRCAGHFNRADAVVAGGLGQHWQNPVVERVVGHEEGERHAHDCGDHCHVGAHRFRDDCQQALGHGIDHAGARQNAREDARGEDQPGDCQHAAGMGGDAVFLLLQAGVVDDHGNAEGDHEQHRQRQDTGDQRDHQGGSQRAIEVQQLGAAGLRELRNGDIAMVGVIGWQVQFTQAGTLTLAVQ
ncbi:hypothetical protein COLO4_02096, partial [Corchorus olitorius]